MRKSSLSPFLAIAALVLFGLGGMALVLLRLPVGDAIAFGPRGVGRGMNGALSWARVTVSAYDGHPRRDFSLLPEEVLLRTEWDLDHDGDWDCAEHLCPDDGICVSKRQGHAWVRDPDVEDCFGHPVDHPHGAAQMLFR